MTELVTFPVNSMLNSLRSPEKCPECPEYDQNMTRIDPFCIVFFTGRMRNLAKSPPVSSIRISDLWARAPVTSRLAKLLLRTGLSTVPGPLARTGMPG